jgi:hypothetical protein
MAVRVKSAREIAARAVCMGVITFRATFEGVRFTGKEKGLPDATEMIAGVTNWLQDAGLWSSLLEAERGRPSSPAPG